MNLFRAMTVRSARCLPLPLVLCTAALALASTARAQQQPQQQNVLVLIADDVGVDAIGCYAAGTAPPPTPNIDALAARGVRMTRAHGCPTCSPTRACIQTGRYPFRTGVGEPLGPTDAGLAASEWLLPEVLAASQRPRAMFGKWHLGNANVATTPNTEGWPWFAGTLSGELSDYFHFDLTTNGTASTVNRYSTTDTADRALAWIGTQNQPWLAMVCFNAGHTPLHVPPGLLHTYNLNGLDPATTPIPFCKAMVQAMDTEIGQLLTGLSAATLANTTVIFVGDNGTSRDVVEAPFADDHAKGTLYEGGIHVPMIFAGPAVAGPPRTSAALVDAVDLFATVAALCGVNARSVVPASVPLDGQDLRSVLLGTAATVRQWSYTEQFGVSPADDGEAMQDTRWKLIRFTGGATVTEELYDLQSDPFEQLDLLSGTLGAEALRAYTRLRVALAHLRGETYVGNFGAGCAGAAGTPALTAPAGAPQLGQMHTVRATPIAAAAATAAFGLLGFSIETTGTAPLPIDLTPYGLTGCWLQVSADSIQSAVLGATAATWRLPIPNNSVLLGLPLYQQMAIAESGANLIGLIFSDALACVIGP